MERTKLPEITWRKLEVPPETRRMRWRRWRSQARDAWAVLRGKAWADYGDDW